MTKKEKIELLKAMHISIINLGDEIAYEHWVTLAVPDEPSEDDFDYIASDEKEFLDCIRIFCNTVRDFS